jgi:ABC-2 type transport system permease protein
MTRALVRKLLRDIRLALIVIALLLFLFECLWAKIAERISGQIIGTLLARGIRIKDINAVLFEGPGKILKTLMGGAALDQAQEMLSIGFVHPLTLTILSVWATGRAAAAIAGEIDRGTLELLLAQPLARARLLLAHFLVDWTVIPVLCLSMWAGISLGAWLADFAGYPSDDMHVDAAVFGPSLLNVAAFLFAVSGFTILLSALGRFRGRVLGLAVLLMLLQFLVNVVAQLWDVIKPLQPLSVFYYYQPQKIILNSAWPADREVWDRLMVLVAVGAAGYLAALWTFTRRDLPAPL